MKHTKRIVAALLSTAMLFATGCGNESSSSGSSKQSSSSQASAEQLSYPITIKVGYSTGADDPRGVALDQFCKTVTEKTNGDVQFEIHPSGELGSDSELITGMIEKTVDMTVSSAGNYALYATKLGVSALPFLFNDFESAWAFIDSPEIRALGEELEGYNMHVLAYFDNGFRCVTTSEAVGPVEKVEDMKGLNIRTPENQIVMETMTELGASPKSYPFAKLMDALKDGTFDAQENPIPVIYNNKLYEAQKYLSITNHSYDTMPLTIRQDIWDQLKPEYRTVIADAAEEAQSVDRGLVKQQTDDCVSKLEEAGMVVTRPDLDPFRKATEGVMEMFRTVYGEDLIAYVQNGK